MLPLKNGAVSLLLILSSFSLIKDILSEGRVVCYYTNWSVYRPGTAKFNPQNINPYLCTHLIYAFGGFTKDNQMKPFDKYQDVEQGGYAKFTGLKTYNKQLKTLIAIGGWNEASSRFSPLVSNAERRQQFIKNILKFLRQNHFDGIDLDWEYPAHREGGKPGDRENYAQFVQEMRAEFERESQKTGRTRLLITMAVPAGIEYIEKGYDIPKLNKYLDWFNVLTYDFHSSEEPSVNHHAPLFSLEEESEYNYDSELNIDYSIKYYLKAGADRDKLVLGIPTYGRSFTLINEESTDIGAPAEAPGDQGDATREKGYLAYYEICQNIKEDPEWTVVQPNPNVMGPYAFRRNQWVGFDDEAIVRKKAAYAVDHGLGGIMFWAIDNDDFRGTCTGKPYPLIEAAKEEMLSLLGLGINEVSKPGPPKKPVRSRSRDNISSSINRISGVLEEKPTSLRNSLSRNRKTSTTTTTTISPSTVTIKLTEVEKSSLYIGGRTTTPAPPTTPDPGADFKCEEEGFFQHPRDCKKYFWCLDSGPSGLGIVAHQFVCPSGLYFNPAADSCDFARNVPCKTKKSTTTTASTSSPTTTTPAISRSTESPVAYKNSFYRTSTTPKITTLKTTRTTTTTSTANYEADYEYEDTDDEVATINRDVDAEEDPKVLKELIQLIRKVGGIDELEKHLLRKEDGTIAIKQGDVATNNPTTPATISKSLYDKVLSRPNTFNSFRNRLTSSSLFRQKNTNSEKIQGESELEQFIPTEESLSKFSSVLRNARPRPQNDGLDKLPEFDAFIKEKKQYVNISRNRPKIINDSIIEEKHPEDEFSDEEEEKIIQTTQRSISSVRPSYASIRRIKPTVPSGTEEGVPAPVSQTLGNRELEKPHSTLNRRRGTTTTTTTEKPRYNTVERVRTLPTTTKISTTTENLANVVEEEGTYTSDEEQQENVRKQENLNVVAATPKTQIYTTQNYANIRSRFKDTASNSTNHLETSAVKTFADISSKISDNNSFVEILPNQNITSTTNATFITSTTPIMTTNIPYKVSDKSSFSKPDINNNSESENHTSRNPQSSTTTSFNLYSSTINDEDLTTTSTSSSTMTPTTANYDLTTKDTDELLDEVTKKFDYQVSLSTETTTEISEKSSVPTTTKTTEFINITTQSNTNNIESLKASSKTNQPQQTTNTPAIDSSTDNTFSNQILGTISSPRPFGFPKRRLTPSTLAPITEDSLNTNKFQENANLVKTVTAVNSNEPEKYLLSPFRSHEVNVSDKNQVNKNISDDPRAEDDEHSTTIENNSTSIPRRKIVFKYRRPLAELNSNNINNINNFNSSVVSETNSNNAATNDSIENQTQINNTASTKRVKKIIRKLINPLNQTHTNLSDSNGTPARRNETFKEKPDKTNVLETNTSATTTATLLRKKLIARRPFKTASTTKYARRKFVEHTTTVPTVDDIEGDEEYEEGDQKQFLLKLTTAIPKARTPYTLKKVNILKNSTSSEGTTEANEPDYEEDKPNEDENNLQISSTPLRNTLTKSVRPPFLPRNRDPTNTNRFVSNRKFKSPSLIYKSQAITNRPAPVKATNLRFFERKFISSTTEIPALPEDLDIEALSARNKKIFDSKKYTTFKNKLQTQPLNNLAAAQEQQQNTENINEIENTTLKSIIHDSTTTTISNETPIVNKTNDNEFSPQADEVVITTPQTPSTTLLHIFTLFDEMSTTTKPVTNVKPRLLSEQPKHKVVEINRIVEITAKEDKLRRKSRKHPDVLEPIGTSSLKVVSLPHLEQLGEISVVKFVHLVDGSDIEIDGHSTVADYTPTEPNIAKNSAPVRNSLPYQYPNYVPAYATERSFANEVLTQRYGKALIPEVIREAVETSTIPLEGLFDHMRQAKNLNGYDSVTEQPEHIANVETTSSTTTITIQPTTQYSKYQQSSTNNPYNIDILTRRPVLSVRRRLIISPDTTTLPNHNEFTASEHDSSNKYNRLRSSPKTSPLSPLLTTAKYQQQSPILTSLNTSVSGKSFLSNQKNGNGKSARISVRRRFQTRRIPSTTKTLTPSATTTKPHTQPTTEETGELKTTQNPLFKRRYNTGATHFPIIPTAATLNQQTYTTLTPTNETDDSVDQVAKSSIHSTYFNQLRKSAKPRKEKTKNINATVVETVQNLGKTSDDIARRIDSGPTLSTNISFTDTSREIISRTFKPKMRYRESFDRIRNKVAKSQFKTRAVPRTETLDFEYYDDDNTSLLGATQNQQLKVILHGPGVIECLDQGNFPHPLSCRKFISCAKYETGGVVGWEYTCPKGTSYDPVGGMCNWAVLGCKD